ncbi:hypothetical protein RchiOBHm_Chr1g0367911 [Rosa chinensis]|uniref:Uncharacterized protein n=1 Tax=Rosa chinensis TaxID=74649 RepID=A0A2P6SKK9_ROSCH|nr:hypothetical protein RchiOBHm_Chr1g0367911 [Rosa chinensis]
MSYIPAASFRQIGHNLFLLRHDFVWNMEQVIPPIMYFPWRGGRTKLKSTLYFLLGLYSQENAFI